MDIRSALRRVAVLCVIALLPFTARATAVVDSVTLDFDFVLDGAYRSANYLAFSGIDFALKQDGAIVASGNFHQDVNGTGEASGVFAGLPLDPHAYGVTQSVTGYRFHVPLTFARGVASALEVYLKAGIIRGGIDFFSGDFGLHGTLYGLDDSLAGPNTTLWAKVTLGTSQPTATATPPDVAHAFFLDDDNPHALAQVTAPASLLIKLRPDGAPFVYDWAEASVRSTLTVTNPVPLPGALPLLAAAVFGLCAAGRRPARTG